MWAATDEPPLGVYVGRLDDHLSLRFPNPLGEAVGGAALGVGARPAAFEGAQLLDQLPASGGVQGQRIIAVAAALSCAVAGVVER